MPSVVRFLFVLLVLAAVVAGSMLALVSFVHVTPRPMEVPIPPGRLK